MWSDFPCKISWRAKNQDGYPVVNRKTYGEKLEHRFVYSSWNNYQFNPEDRVLHHCDNPGCIEPEHLFLGTQVDNMRDRQNKGRQAHNRGEATGKTTKFKDEDIIKIRKEYDSGKYTRKELAEYYGVATSTMSYIIDRKTWTHI